MAEYTVDEIKNKISLDAQEAIKQIEKIITLTGKLGDNVEKTGKKGLGGFLGSLKLGAVIYLGQKALKTLKNMTLEAFNYIETINLFEVAMGKNVAGMEEYYDRAVKFQNQLEEAFGANTAETMKYQAFFNQMSKSMGIANEQAYLLSENFTKLGMDISSLFNIEQGDAMAKLRAGLAGQTKPLRDIGLDITQQSLQPILSELGIDKAVKQMSQAEKMILRYIAVIRQASASHGDFAKTIESPMNQIRVFQNQIAIFKRNVGSLFSGMFASIMPYVNGILMAINAIVKAIATLFGITLESANTGNISQGIGADDLASDLDSASGSAKELKKTLMGFDEINNIAEPTSGGSGGGTSGAAGGGVDPRLLEAMKEYDNLMENVQMKANKIRDNVLDWLGFSKDLNGELKWTWERMDGIAKILAIGITVSGFFGLKSILKKLATFLAATKIGLLLGKIKFAFLAVVGGAATFKEGLAFVSPFLAKIAGAFTALATALGITVGTLTAIVTAILAVAGVVVYLNLSPSIKQMDIFKGASKETEKALKGLVDEFNFLETELKKQSWGSKIITDSDITKTRQSLNKITSAIKAGLEDSKNTALKDYNDALKKAMGEEFFEEMYNKTSEYYDNLSKITSEKESEILNIQTKAKEEGRALTEEEQKQITKLYDELKTTTVTTLSESEEEAQLILGRMKQNAKALSAEQASEVIKNSIKMRDETIKNAEDTYTRQIEEAERLKEAGVITEDQYNKMIKSSETARDDMIKNAEKTHNDTYKAFVNSNEDVAKYIDEDTGKIKSKWKKFWDDVGITISAWWKEKVAPWFTKEKWSELFSGIKDGLSAKIDTWKKRFNPIKDWWNNNVAPWFTKEKWAGIGLDATNGIKNAFSKFNFKIKMPHFAWTSTPAKGWIADTLKALGLPSSLPKLNVEWYAKGGFPDIGQMFIARESGPEMVGKIGGRTSVANNDQIVEAVSRGVFEAVSSAMANGNQSISLNITTEEGIIVNKAVNGINDYITKTGSLPFPVPIN